MDQEDKIKVVILEPGKISRTAKINKSLKSMQKIVGGDIEAFYPFEEQVCFICNDEGKINGMPLNRAIYGDEKEIIEIIAGSTFLCDCSCSDFNSLSNEQLERYSKLYKYPERFYEINGDIKAVPYKPLKEKER